MTNVSTAQGCERPPPRLVPAVSTDQPLVSVIMSVHNAERYVEDAMGCILGQSYRRLELVVVDDGSSDATLKVIRSFEDSRIRVLERPHRGLVASLNEAISLASGELVARMDADDLCHVERLERQVAFLLANPTIDVVATNFLRVDAEGRLLGRSVAFGHCEEIRLALCVSNIFAHGSVMMRRKVFDAIGLYDPEALHAEDWDFWIRASRVTRLAVLPETLFTVRYHSASVTATELEQQERTASVLRAGAFDWFLANRSRYKLLSYHPRCYADGLFHYHVAKSTLYRRLAHLALLRGLRWRGAAYLTCAIIAAPWWKRNYRHMAAVVRPSLILRARY